MSNIAYIDGQNLHRFDDWNEQKKILHAKKPTIYFKEADVWWVGLGINIGSEAIGKGENFRRPILVLKKLSATTCLAIPLSTKEKTGSRYCSYRLHNQQGTALLYQIKMMHCNRFQRKIGEMDENDFADIKKKLHELLH